MSPTILAAVNSHVDSIGIYNVSLPSASTSVDLSSLLQGVTHIFILEGPGSLLIWTGLDDRT